MDEYKLIHSSDCCAGCYFDAFSECDLPSELHGKYDCTGKESYIIVKNIKWILDNL